MTNRLFVALDIPSEIQDSIISLRDEIYGPASNVRWEAKNKLHLTLKFLGDVEQSMNDEIIDAVGSAVCRYDSMSLSFNKFGLFYRDNKPKILWLGFNYPEELIKLAGEMEDNLEPFGFRKEKRKFKPHLTLLRLKGFEDLSKIEKFTQYKLNKEIFTADKVSLIKSKLTPQGSVYTRVKSFNMNINKEE